MTTRHTTHGNSRSHIVHPGYRYESAQHARFERPDGEPSLFVGTLIVLAVFAVIGILGVLM